jgi:hypothetical protein
VLKTIKFSLYEESTTIKRKCWFILYRCPHTNVSVNRPVPLGAINNETSCTSDAVM